MRDVESYCAAIMRQVEKGHKKEMKKENMMEKK